MNRTIVGTLIVAACYFSYQDYTKANDYGINKFYPVSKNGYNVVFGESYIEKVNDGKRHYIDFCKTTLKNVKTFGSPEFDVNKIESEVIRNKESCVIDGRTFIYDGNKYVIDTIDIPDDAFKCNMHEARWNFGELDLSDDLIGSGRIVAHVYKKQGNINYIDSLKTENGYADIIYNALNRQEAVLKGHSVDWCHDKRKQMSDYVIDWINGL